MSRKYLFYFYSVFIIFLLLIFVLFIPSYLDEDNWRLYFSLSRVKLIYIEKKKSKSLALGCCLAFARFFANFSLVLLIKVLLMKKACSSIGVIADKVQ